jgi:hypothetical protein
MQVYMLGRSIGDEAGSSVFRIHATTSADLLPAHVLHLLARVWMRFSRDGFPDSLSSQVSATRSRPKLR